MKTFIKIFLLLVAALAAVALTILLVFYFSAGLQKQVVLGALNDRPGVRAEADYFRLTLGGGEIRNLSIMVGMDGVNVGSVRLRYSPWGLFRKEFRLAELSVENLLVDLSSEGGAGFAHAFGAPSSDQDRRAGESARGHAERDWDSFEGILAESQKEGYRLVIGKVEVDGVVLMPEGDRLELGVTMEDWAPGAMGRMEAVLTGQMPSPRMALSEGEVSLSLDVVQAPGGGLEAMAGHLRIAGLERGAPDPIEVEVSFEVGPTPRGERYTILASRERVETPLLRGEAEWIRSSQRLEGTARVAIADGDLNEFLSVANLPVIVAGGQAAFAFSPARSEGRFNLDLDASLTELSRLGEGLAGFEPLRVSTRIALHYDPELVQVNEMQGRLFQQDSSELLSLAVVRPFEIQLEAEDLGLDGLSGDVLRLRMERFPLQLLEPFMEGYNVSGFTLPTEAVIAVNQKRLELRATAPVGVAEFRLQQGEQLLVSGIEVRMTPRMEWSGEEEATVELKDLRVSGPDGRLFAGSGGAVIRDFNTFNDGTFEFRGDADLARVSMLPVFSASAGPGVQSGMMRLELQGTLEAVVRAKGLVHIRDLRPGGYQGRPYSIRLEPELIVQPTHRFQLVSGITLTGPGTTTSGNFTAAGGEADSGQLFEFQAELTLDVLDVEEWQPLLAVLPETAAEPVEVSDEPDTAPLWEGLDGRAVASIQRLILGETAIQDFRAEATVEQGRKVTVKMTGASGEAPLDLSASLRFDDSRRAMPYVLEGGLSVRDFDVTPFLRPPGGEQPGILEGTFDVNGEFGSTAANLARIGERLQGSFQLESASAGVLRPLGERTQIASTASNLLGALMGNVRELRWAQLVLDQLREVPYDRVIFRVERAADLDIVLREFDLVSRETRIRGGGRIEHHEGVDLLDLPLSLNFELSAKGQLADALREGRQLKSSTPDDLGYLQGPTFPIEGSLGNPSSLLMNTLMGSAQSLLPGLLAPREN